MSGATSTECSEPLTLILNRDIDSPHFHSNLDLYAIGKKVYKDGATAHRLHWSRAKTLAKKSPNTTCVEALDLPLTVAQSLYLIPHP